MATIKGVLLKIRKFQVYCLIEMPQSRHNTRKRLPWFQQFGES